MFCCYKLIDVKSEEAFYIGKCSLERLNRRKTEHKSRVKNLNNNHCYNKIRKLLREGNNFEIVPLRTFLTEEESYEGEKELISLYRNMGYNLCNSTDGGEGLRNPSLETRQKMSENASKRFSGDGNPSKRPEVKKLRSEFFKKNNPMFNEDFKNKAVSRIKESCCKSVLQFDLQGNLIKEFEGIREAHKQLNISREGISRCCQGKLETSGGYKWKYKVTL